MLTSELAKEKEKFVSPKETISKKEYVENHFWVDDHNGIEGIDNSATVQLPFFTPNTGSGWVPTCRGDSMILTFHVSPLARA